MNFAHPDPGTHWRRAQLGCRRAGGQRRAAALRRRSPRAQPHGERGDSAARSAWDSSSGAAGEFERSQSTPTLESLQRTLGGNGGCDPADDPAKGFPEQPREQTARRRVRSAAADGGRSIATREASASASRLHRRARS